ncbi:glucokinase [Roseateles sp. DB2]|uniref:glucokinase n=1 Tax=Roseateles sp. DB2 TaxID=3453717 RepID=UPI003EE896D9
MSGALDHYPWLLADVGGSNARFGWVDGPGAPVGSLRSYAVQDFPGLEEAARRYLQDLDLEQQAQGRRCPAPRYAAVAVATAVAGDEVVLTNSRWRFSRQQLQAALQLRGLRVLNDFEALALSLPRLRAQQLRAWGGGAPTASGCLAVIGPGTGLGVAAVVQTPQGWQALPGEGGHATLAPADDFESALLAHVRGRHAHVSAERLLSGIGLPTLHEAVSVVLAGQPPVMALTPELILERGLTGQDPLCERTLDCFCAMLGGFAGSVALTLGARGGVYVGGGIVPRLGDYFFQSRFRERFEAKGRFQPYLAGIPTALITDTLAALGGVALAIEQSVPFSASAAPD